LACNYSAHVHDGKITALIIIQITRHCVVVLTALFKVANIGFVFVTALIIIQITRHCVVVFTALFKVANIGFVLKKRV